jgi:hypothetical protein
MGSRLCPRHLKIVFLWGWSLGTMLSGCAPAPAPQVSTAVPYRVLSADGPSIENNDVRILTAPSLNSLLTMAVAIGDRPHPSDCSKFGLQKYCWTGIKQPVGTILFALLMHVPCRANQSLSASLSNSMLTFDLVGDSPNCPPGAALPIPSLALVSIPGDRLPPRILRVIENVDDGSARASYGTILDHRQPPIALEDQTFRASVDDAQTRAMADAHVRDPRGFYSLSELGVIRMPAGGADCSRPGSTSDPVGYALVLAGARARRLEYRINSSQTLLCSRS